MASFILRTWVRLLALKTPKSVKWLCSAFKTWMHKAWSWDIFLLRDRLWHDWDWHDAPWANAQTSTQHIHTHTQSWKTMNHFHLPVIHLGKSPLWKKEVPAPTAFQLNVYRTTHQVTLLVFQTRRCKIKHQLSHWCGSDVTPNMLEQLQLVTQHSIPLSGNMILISDMNLRPYLNLLKTH